MDTFINAFSNFLRSLAREDDGAQIIEYALIIAVVSIALIVALSALTTTDFATFITRVGTCLNGGTCA